MAAADREAATNWDRDGDYGPYRGEVADVDRLQGGPGDDTYPVSPGDGLVRIDDADGANRILLGGGLAAENIVLSPGGTYHPGEFRIDLGGPVAWVRGDLAAGASSVEFVESADGFAVSAAEFPSYLIGMRSGTAGNDTFHGGVGPQDIEGGTGDDLLHGDAGRDSLYGGAGDDALYGDSGDDELRDEIGDNLLSGGAGNDRLFGRGLLSGGTGDDTLTAEGPAILDGGAGNDALSAADDSVILFGLGDGTDSVGGRGYVVRLKEGVAPGDVRVEGRSLPGFGGRADLVLGDGSRLSGVDGAAEVRFADGSRWLAADLAGRGAALPTDGNDLLAGTDDEDSLSGGAGNDTLGGGPGNDTLAGNDGADKLVGGGGDDVLDGGAGDDALTGGEGNDVLAGGAGADALGGGSGWDTYALAAGSGHDTVTEVADGSGTTVLAGAGVGVDSLAVERDGTDLRLVGPGGADSLTIAGWLDRPTGSGPLEVRFASGARWDENAILSRLDASGGAPDGDFRPNILAGGDGNDALAGRGGADTLTGSAGDDTLDGGAGDDLLQGGSGNDLLIGGAGNDVYLFGIGSGDDRIVGDGGDMVRLGAGIRAPDLRTEVAGSDLVLRLAGGDSLTLAGWAPVRRAVLADGTVVDLLAAADGPLLGSPAADSFTATANNDQCIAGMGGDDSIAGAGGDDFLSGGTGNDTLRGGGGRDTLDGGAGNDVLVAAGDWVNLGFASGRDSLVDSPAAILFDADVTPADVGIASLYLAPVVHLADGNGDYQGWLRVSVGSTASLGDLRVNSDGDGAATLTTDFVFADGTVWRGNEILGHLGWGRQGTANGEALTGSAGPDVLSGGNGGDGLAGGAGNDSLAGDAGADDLWGGAGNDTLAGGDDGDDLHGGAGDDLLDGGAGSDQLVGGDGADTYRFAGHWGSDTVLAGAGDSLEVSVSAEDIRVSLDAAADGSSWRAVLVQDGTTNGITVVVSTAADEAAGYAMPLEMHFAGGAAWTAADLVAHAMRPTAGADHLAGSTDADRIDSGDGSDTVSGGAGDDRLFGGAGNDRLGGNAGNDLLAGGAGDDFLSGGPGSDLYRYERGDGHDVILDAGDPGEVDTLQFGDGIAAADIVRRIDGDAVELDLGGGDRVTLLAGVERVRFADGAILDAATWQPANHDLVFPAPGRNVTVADGLRFDSLLMPVGVLPADLFATRAGEDLLLRAGGAVVEFSGWFGGPADAGVLEAVFADGAVLSSDRLSTLALDWGGSAGDDRLVAAAGFHNRLDGGEGNDTLVAGDTADTLVGGAGDDRYLLHSPGDRVVEAPDGGFDSVLAPFSYTLSDGVENLELQGSDAIDGTGNAGDNRLLGNAGANRLSGGAGNDVYGVDNAADQVVELPGGGHDVVISSIDYALPAEVEDLVLGGSAQVDGVGNAADNLITGNAAPNLLQGLAGNDTLDGGPGRDTLVGGAGDDTYRVDATGDRIVENAGEGLDTVVATATFALAANVDNLALAGHAAIDGTGNADANVLTGNDAANRLTGGAGNDTVDGGRGADFLDGGAGDDLYLLAAGAGEDVIVESGGADRVLFASGGVADLMLRWQGDDLVVSLRDSPDRVTVAGFRLAGRAVEEIAFAGGGSLAYDAIVAAADSAPADRAPVLAKPLTDAVVAAGGDARVALPADWVADADAGDRLALIATLVAGGELPAWLAFDPATGVFAGMPKATDAGRYDIRVLATDMGNLSVSDVFTLTVVDDSDTAPAVVVPMADVVAVEGVYAAFALPAGMFADADAGDVLTVTARQADGRPLPAWLQFNGADGSFRALPPAAAVGDLFVAVAATDSHGRSVTDVFAVGVADADDPPKAVRLLPDLTLAQGDAVDVTITADAFVDPEGGPLALSVAGGEGAPLPGWLSYDPSTGHLAGTTAGQLPGMTEIRVTATDTAGAHVTDSFAILIAEANDPPAIVHPLADMSATEGEAVVRGIPADTFHDPDRGDRLTYSLSILARPDHARTGFALNGADQLVSNGVPGYWDVGTWALRLTATDRFGAATSDDFQLLVRPAAVNHAPLLARVGEAWNEVGSALRRVYLYGSPEASGWIRLAVPLASPAGNAGGVNDIGFVDVDGDPLDFSLAGAAGNTADWRFDPGSGELQFRPGTGRRFEWTVSATDPGGLAASYRLTVTVDSTPVAGEVPRLILTENESSGYSLPSDLFTDADGDLLAYTGSSLATGATEWARFDPATRSYSFAPPDPAPGDYTLTVTAADAYAGYATIFGTPVVPRVGWTSVDIPVTVLNAYDPPRLAAPLPDRTAVEDSPFSFAAGAYFIDVDPGATLTYSATLADGGPLPAWLSVAAGTGALSGTPRLPDTGVIDVAVTAADGVGGTASDVFSLTVALAPRNHAPILAGDLPDQVFRPGRPFAFALPSGTFMDVDPGDRLSYAAFREGGGPLPPWLHFDAAALAFSGTMPADQTLPTRIAVTASDGHGAETAGDFAIAVDLSNLPPVVTHPLADLAGTEGRPFAVAVAADAFVDPDGSAPLRYSLSLADGAPLPGWLRFDPEALQLAGVPAAADAGTWFLRLTATDERGATATDSFRLVVAAVNHPPVARDDRLAATEDQPLTIAAGDLLANDGDPDGDSLAITGVAAPRHGTVVLDRDGSISWLADPDFSGDAGFEYTLSDGAGASATARVTVLVAAVNDGPVAVQTLADAVALAGTFFSYVLPSDLFADADPGDALRLSLSRADGGAAPDWLHFDAATGELSGTPAAGDAGRLALRILARDAAGAAAGAPLDVEVRAADLLLAGTSGADDLAGGPGNDTLAGNGGADRLAGAEGDDSFLFAGDAAPPGPATRLFAGSPGNPAATQAVVRATGHWGASARMDGGAGTDDLRGTTGNDLILLDDGADSPCLVSVERIAAGDGDDIVDLSSRRWQVGKVSISGGDGNDALWSSLGDDLLDGGGGNDVLIAGAGDDALLGGDGDDRLAGEAGDDILLGGAGSDVVEERAGHNLLAGGEGADLLCGGNDAEILVGGKGNDIVTGNQGADVICFNAGDGVDHVYAGNGSEDCLSLGGGIRYQDLWFRVSGNDLVIEVGAADRLALGNWYAAGPFAERGIGRLQMLVDAMDAYAADVADGLYNRRVTEFDFQALTARFDAARAADPALTRWQPMAAFMDALRGGWDDAAIGGDLAFAYGKQGTFSRIGDARGVLAAPGFGLVAQSLAVPADGTLAPA